MDASPELQQLLDVRTPLLPPRLVISAGRHVCFPRPYAGDPRAVARLLADTVSRGLACGVSALMLSSWFGSPVIVVDFVH
jgi:hypothetical protein